MAKILVLHITDFINALDKAVLFLDNGAEGEAVNSGSAGTLFGKGGSSGNGGIDRNIFLVIFLLQIGAQSHE